MTSIRPVSTGGSISARARAWPVAAAGIAYIGLAVAGFWQSWSRGVAHTMTCACSDPGQSVWFLEWTSFALSHGHNPFFTQWLNVPHGVNLMDNASMPLLGALMTPVTLVVGPVASWNILATGAIAGSALAAFCVFRRYARWWPAAFAGGLVYGFGPYMATQGADHLNLSFAVFPPLVLWIVEKLLVRRDGSPWKWGIALGALCAGQVLVSTEVLATSVIMAILCVVFLAVLSRRDLARRWSEAGHGGIDDAARYLTRCVAAAIATFSVICAYPLWMSQFGPAQVGGQEATNTTFISANLLGFVLPSSNQHFTVASTRSLVDKYFVGGFIAENTTFLGVTLLLCVAAVVVMWRREAIVRIAAFGIVAAAVLSLGSRLFVGTDEVGWLPLPYSALSGLPLVRNILPARFALYVDLFAGLLLAVGLDRVHERLSRRTVRWTLPALIGVAAMVPAIPAWPYAMRDTAVPPYFTSLAVRKIPPGSIADVYPFPRVTQAEAMVFQAETAMRFKMEGGFALVPGLSGKGTEFGPQSTTEVWFGSAYWISKPFEVDPGSVTDARAEWRRLNVATVIVAQIGADPGGARMYVTSVLGRPPADEDGVWVWYGVQADLAHVAGS